MMLPRTTYHARVEFDISTGLPPEDAVGYILAALDALNGLEDDVAVTDVEVKLQNGTMTFQEAR
ncbi:MAG TPA: hypothetical protein VLI07_18660 [Candidatus Binatus sp.]|nr:hypothetical protein [Candidatus Binatus sp.]